jgi:two-component system, NtrC family, nitrogen regulation sensor histidine kinase NtrY
MVFKRLRFQVVIRLLLMLITMGFSCWWIPRSGLGAAPVLIAGLLLIQIAALLRIIEKPRKDLIRFFQAIEYSDFSETFSVSSQDKSLEPMRTAFERVIQAFQKARAEKEAHFRYLQTVVQHVGIGILVFKQDGQIDLVNQSVKKILGIRQLRQIDQLSRLDPNFPLTLKRLESGERTQVQILDPVSEETVTLSLHATRFILQNVPYTLISVQNIQSELEEKELDAWQNLIRVLTHEIMNSVTPIASLASTANRLLGKIMDRIDECPDWKESIGDVGQAVKTIESRSQGLLKFVESYRSLTRIPKPEFQIVSVRELFDRVSRLMSPKFEEKGIRFSPQVEPESLEITADPNLIEQVLINLLQNAFDWAGQKPGGKIVLSAGMGNTSRPTIQVKDNGPGIEKEVLEKIFIPFFTTKPDGSGIGLSLSRQIMRMHSGNISVQSSSGGETVFTLKF